MLKKRSWLLALGIAALATLCWSDAAVAKLAANKLAANGFLPTGLTSNMTLRAVRLALPDGTEFMFR
jgi:hypothetical protein